MNFQCHIIQLSSSLHDVFPFSSIPLLLITHLAKHHPIFGTNFCTPLIILSSSDTSTCHFIMFISPSMASSLFHSTLNNYLLHKSFQIYRYLSFDVDRRLTGRASSLYFTTPCTSQGVVLHNPLYIN